MEKPILTFQVEKELKDEIEKARKHDGMKRSEWIRFVISQQINKDRPSPYLVSEEMMSWRGELHRVGINLNRLTHHFNMGLAVSSKDVEGVQAELLKVFRDLAMKFREVERELQTRR